jgi:type IX secretion system PorP/SprF family membrane protein
MKKITLLLFVCAAFSTMIMAQSVPLYTQYNLNPFTINPAAAGMKEGQQINFNYRSQWTDFPTAPVTSVLSYQGRFNNNGVGLIVFDDKTGALNYQGVLAGYNYRIKLSDDHTLALGLATQFLRYSVYVPEALLSEEIDMTDVVLQDALAGVNQLDASFGVMFYAKKGLYGGVSLPGLIQTKLNGTNDFNDFKYLATHFFALAGYKTQGKNINIEPSILVRKVVNTPFQVELNTKFWFLQDQLMAGVTYRTAEQALAFTLGFEINKKLGFFYAYDANFNEISNYNSGSHELMIQYRFGGKKNEVVIEE